MNTTDRDELKAVMREVLLAEDTRRLLAEAMKASIDEAERKKVVKAALHEWLEEKYAAVGKWSLRGLAALAVGALLMIAMWDHGWRPPH